MAAVAMLAATAIAERVPAAPVAVPVSGLRPTGCLWVRHFDGGCPLDAGATSETRSADSPTGGRAVSRLTYLLSGMRLDFDDGTSAALSDPSGVGIHLFDPLETTPAPLPLPTSPALVRGLSFHIGPPPELNHSDPARWPAGHPLNPLENNLHWGWRGGYVFLAAEGRSAPVGGMGAAFLFHLGHDRHRVAVTVPLPKTPRGPAAAGGYTLTAHVDRLWRGLTLAEGASAIHSTGDDPLADKIAANLPAMFELRAGPPEAKRLPEPAR